MFIYRNRGRRVHRGATLAAPERNPQPAHRFPYDPARVKVVACATVIEEMTPRMPDAMAREVLDFGLHFKPGGLTAALQEVIDRSTGFDALLLGYGLCSRGVVGVVAKHCKLVMPRVDDCIAIFLGSKGEYARQHEKEPGTYYLTKGWIEAKDSPLDSIADLTPKYGEEKAERIVKIMLKNYTRIAYIDTGAYEQARYRAYAQENARRFDLRYEEIEGSPTLVEKLLYGPWDEECVVIEQGGTVRYEDFVAHDHEAPAAVPGLSGPTGGPAGVPAGRSGLPRG
jgi:hypothetical protein